MKHLVQKIYKFFYDNPSLEKHKTLSDFLDTLPGFRIEEDNGISRIDMNLANYVSSICKQMANDMLLIPVKTNPTFCLPHVYYPIGESNIGDYAAFLEELEYGSYDFKYQGFVYTRNWFEKSIIPIVGKKENKDEDIGSAYYIGGNMFVTAAHCINGLKTFNLLLNNEEPIKLKEVWFAKDVDPQLYDIAVIIADEEINLPALKFGEVSVLDPVIVIGYPPVPGMLPIQTVETATVGAIIPQQKSAIGEVVAPSKNYFSQLDYFIINARVKGGNSGGPVINQWGKVIGTVVETPFDSQGGCASGRYDIMGYGLCLPSKYVTQVIDNPDIKKLHFTGSSYTCISK
jgi:serine protease Do